MGNCFRNLFWGGDPDGPNALSGLSSRDVHLVKKSWSPIFKNCVPNGILLFTMFFRSEPEALSYFRCLKNARERQYDDSPQFRAHVINVMTSLNIAIGYLNQPEVVRDIMRKVGDAHCQKQIHKRHFDVFKSVIITMISGRGCDGDTVAAWRRTIDFFYRHIYDNLEKDQGPTSRARGVSYIYFDK